MIVEYGPGQNSTSTQGRTPNTKLGIRTKPTVVFGLKLDKAKKLSAGDRKRFDNFYFDGGTLEGFGGTMTSGFKPQKFTIYGTVYGQKINPLNNKFIGPDKSKLKGNVQFIESKDSFSVVKTVFERKSFKTGDVVADIRSDYIEGRSLSIGGWANLFKLRRDYVVSDAQSSLRKSKNSNSDDIEGVWTGNVSTVSKRKSWNIKATFASGSYLIDYPSLKCGGKMKLIKSERGIMEFREKLTYGRWRCSGKGRTVFMKLGKNKIKYEWYYPNGKKGVTGILTK